MCQRIKSKEDLRLECKRTLFCVREDGALVFDGDRRLAVGSGPKQKEEEAKVCVLGIEFNCLALILFIKALPSDHRTVELRSS